MDVGTCNFCTKLNTREHGKNNISVCILMQSDKRVCHNCAGKSPHAVLPAVGHVDKPILVFVLLVDHRHTRAVRDGIYRGSRFYQGNLTTD